MRVGLLRGAIAKTSAVSALAVDQTIYGASVRG
jgi:hypothetical protein